MLFDEDDLPVLLAIDDDNNNVHFNALTLLSPQPPARRKFGLLADKRRSLSMTFFDSTSTEPILYRYERHVEYENDYNKLARPHSTYTIMNNDTGANVDPSTNHQRSMTDLTNEHAPTSTTTKASTTQRRRAFAQSLSANVLQRVPSFGGCSRRRATAVVMDRPALARRA
ncbi:unnamed protein product [Sphagnum balticum]